MTWRDMTTAEKIEALKPFAAVDAPASEIAEVLGCSRNAVIGMWGRYSDQIGRVKLTAAERSARSKLDAKRADAGGGGRREADGRHPSKRYDCARPETLIERACGTPGVRLIDTDAFHCRWIDGQPTADAMCCGAPRMSEASPYCEAHHHRAYVKAAPPKSTRPHPDTGNRRPGVADRAFYPW